MISTNCCCLSNCGRSSIQRATMNIYKMLQNKYKDNFVNVGPLIVQSLHTERCYARTSLRMTGTLHRMFEFDGCIDVTFE